MNGNTIENQNVIEKSVVMVRFKIFKCTTYISFIYHLKLIIVG